MSPIVLATGQPSARELHQAALTLLRTTSVTTYDGQVPDDVPINAAGQVKPYAVLWPSPGSFPSYEASPLSEQDAGELAWTCRVTVAAGDPWWVLDAAAGIRSLLSRARLVPRAGLLKEPEGYMPQVQKDPDSKPVRWFVPLVFDTMSA